MNPNTAKPIRPLARGSLRMQSDSRLLKLFRRGVEPAFDEIVLRYRGALVGYAGAIAGKDRAEDVVQESLMKAHRSLSGDESIEPKPWLYTVVRNTALNDIRDNRKHSHAEMGEPAGRTHAPHELAEQKEELAAIVAAVSDLPASQRQALIGHELGGFSHEEIAQELELTAGATKQLIYRARLTLRNALGALIPFPLIAWLVSDTAGVVATGATGAAAGGAIGASSGGAAMGTAGGGGVMAAIAGAGGAKLAVVAVVAGGTIATGVAVEQHQANSNSGSQTAEVRTATESSADSAQLGSVIVSDGQGPSGGSGGSGGSKSGSGSGDGSSKKDDNSNGAGVNPGSGESKPSSPVQGDGTSGLGSKGSGRGSTGGSTEGSGSGPSGKGREGDSSGKGGGDVRPAAPVQPGVKGGDSPHGGSGGSGGSGGTGGSGESGGTGGSGGSGGDSGSGSSGGGDTGSGSGSGGSGGGDTGSGSGGLSGSGSTGSGSGGGDTGSGSSGSGGGTIVTPPPAPKDTGIRPGSGGDSPSVEG